jgi:phage major head subunit gpT-like protein
MFNPIAIEKGLNAKFAQAMVDFFAARQLAPGIMRAVLEIMSTGAYEKLGWVGSMPVVQQWLGELNAKEFESYEYAVKNKDWATSILVNENDVDDDQLGIYGKFPAMLAKRLLSHIESLAINLLINGTSGLAFDGIAFFSNASGKRTIDNLLGGTGTTLAQIAADISSAKVAMAKFTDDNGETLNIKGSMIVCPVAMEDNFNRLVSSTADPTATGGTNTYNPFGGKFVVVADPRLDAADANDWYMLATNEIMQPLVISLRQTAKNRFEKKNLTKTWVWSADYRGDGGYGLPHLAVKVVNS